MSRFFVKVFGLQFAPGGPYTGQVQAVLQGLSKLTKAPVETKEKN